VPRSSLTRLLVCALLLAAVLTAGLLVLHQPRASALAACGAERWAVKTLADGQARKVNFRAHATSVSALRRLPPTHTYARATGVERRTFRIKARLVETKIEDDQDIHLVVADPRARSHTLIVEFPAPACTTHSVKRSAMLQARRAFVSACGQPAKSSFHFLHGTATLTGVGFFDFNHGQTGVAPNAIELHPVLHAQVRGCAPSKPWGRWANYRPPPETD
jgi:hypothetical protein